MKITVLNENHVNQRGLLAEHGLSLLLEEEGEQWLFDTGQSDVYIKNAQALKKNLKALKGIIISHGHYDHCGGLAYFEGKAPDIYIRKEALCRKMAGERGTDTFRDIGIPWEIQRFSKEFVFAQEIQEIRENWFLVGKMKSIRDWKRNRRDSGAGRRTGWKRIRWKMNSSWRSGQKKG